MCIAELVANHPLSSLFLLVFFVQGVTVETFSCFRAESNSNFIRHILFSVTEPFYIFYLIFLVAWNVHKSMDPKNALKNIAKDWTGSVGLEP